VLELGVVLLHKSVQKVLTRVLRPVRDQAGGMKMGVQLLTRYTLFRSFKRYNIAIYYACKLLWKYTRGTQCACGVARFADVEIWVGVHTCMYLRIYYACKLLWKYTCGTQCACGVARFADVEIWASQARVHADITRVKLLRALFAAVE